VGRRVRDKVSLNDLFLRFKCHYGFSVSFCNPDAGHEKRHVENVGEEAGTLAHPRNQTH
jgi:transposase